jgi:hypothetical protein
MPRAAAAILGSMRTVPIAASERAWSRAPCWACHDVDQHSVTHRGEQSVMGRSAAVSPRRFGSRGVRKRGRR